MYREKPGATSQGRVNSLRQTFHIFIRADNSFAEVQMDTTLISSQTKRDAAHIFILGLLVDPDT